MSRRRYSCGRCTCCPQNDETQRFVGPGAGYYSISVAGVSDYADTQCMDIGGRPFPVACAPCSQFSASFIFPAYCHGTVDFSSQAQGICYRPYPNGSVYSTTYSIQYDCTTNQTHVEVRMSLLSVSYDSTDQNNNIYCLDGAVWSRQIKGPVSCGARPFTNFALAYQPDPLPTTSRYCAFENSTCTMSWFQ
jgi:hypothetical protein